MATPDVVPPSAAPSASPTLPQSLPLPVLADRLGQLQEALAAAQARADQGTGQHAERVALKDDIIALFRQVDAAVLEAQALKEQVKQLAAAWKQLAPTPIASAPVASARVDHLGASTFIEKGWSKLSLGDPSGAEATLRKAMQLAPGNTEAETLLGWALLQQGQLEPARQALHGVLLRDGTNPLARATLGYLHLRAGNLPEASEQLAQALRSDRDRKATLYALLYQGMVHYEQAQFAEAEACYRRALELGPNLVQAWYELGRTHWYAGRPDDAREAWRAGSAANKFSPWGKRCADVILEVEQGGAPPRID